MHYLAIDPGAQNTGIAAFDEKGNVEQARVFKGQDRFMDWLESIEEAPKVIILENYRTRSMRRGNAMSTQPTIQLIGMIKRHCKKYDIKLVLQEPSPCLTIGMKYLGLSQAYKDRHIPDEVSALAHGTFYLVKAKIKKVDV